MIIVGDGRMPAEAQEKLKSLGIFYPLLTQRISYDAISGHPDIFFCQIDDKLIVAKNLPEQQKLFLRQHHLVFEVGKNRVGEKYPASARYNALATNHFLFYNPKITDDKIIAACKNRKQIVVKQGYTRCNLFALPDESFITSDKGIFNTLLQNGLEVLLVNPKGILLQGFPHGFIGGCMGLYNKTVFIIGNLHFYSEGEKIRRFITGKSLRIVELYNGPLFDGGSLFFLKNSIRNADTTMTRTPFPE